MDIHQSLKPHQLIIYLSVTEKLKVLRPTPPGMGGNGEALCGRPAVTWSSRVTPDTLVTRLASTTPFRFILIHRRTEPCSFFLRAALGYCLWRATQRRSAAA